MLFEYTEKLQSKGKLSFTIEQAMKDLNATSDSIRSAVSRLKKKGRLISPAKGFYILYRQAISSLEVCLRKIFCRFWQLIMDLIIMPAS